MNTISKSLELAGRTLSFETGKFARRSTSSVLARYGETVVLATVVLGDQDLKKDYFPLSVDYQERLYAGGRIKGSRWVKREGRPTDAEVLSARLIDRSIRPLFPKNFSREVQVVVTVLSTDGQNDADVLGVNAVSAALAISLIPWNGPIACVRIGLDQDQVVVNPANGDRQGARLDLVVSSTADLITMIEAGATQISDDIIFSGLQTAHSQSQSLIKTMSEMVAEINNDKLPFSPPDIDSKLRSQVEKKAIPAIDSVLDSARGQPILEREYAYEIAREEVILGFPDSDPKIISSIIDSLFTSRFRQRILDSGLRPDGRQPDTIRPLQIEAGLIPRVHGSALFQRGDTQALTITTLGAPSLYQSLESAEGEEQKRYMHHYNMPPFATGETGRMGSPGRREIGHGALAERALLAVIPPESEFPYAIRTVSEILSSNGSTSMASTCGSTLSLMDAGVPLSAPVAGISIGLITPEGYPKKSTGYVLLTDITGGEDHYGDMDFKVAGTTSGITAIQLDVKVPGLSLDICQETLARARATRLQILDSMLKVLPASHSQVSPHAPKISTTHIPTDKIGELIGPGGKVIKKLMADTDTAIDVRDDGAVFISGTDPAGVAQALNWIDSLGKEVVPGEIYEGTVARLQPFGAFVNILPGKDGLVHVSQMASGFVSDPSEVVSEGQQIKVWVTEIDSQGRINLSMLFDESGQPLKKAPPSRSDHPRPAKRGLFNAPVPRRPDRRRR